MEYPSDNSSENLLLDHLWTWQIKHRWAARWAPETRGQWCCCDCVTAGPLIQDMSGRRTACHQHPALPMCTDKPSAAQFLGNALQEFPGAVWVSPPGLLLSLFSLAALSPAAGSGDVVPTSPGVQTSHPFWQGSQGTKQVLPGLN